MSAKDDFLAGLSGIVSNLVGYPDTDPDDIRELNEKAAALTARPADEDAFNKFVEVAASWEFKDDTWQEVGGGWTIERVGAFFDLEDDERAIGIMKAEEAFEKRSKAPSPPPPAPKPASAPAAASSRATTPVKAAPADDKEQQRLRDELERIRKERDELLATAAEAEAARAEAQAKLDAMTDPAELEAAIILQRQLIDEAHQSQLAADRKIAQEMDALVAAAETEAEAAAARAEAAAAHGVAELQAQIAAQSAVMAAESRQLASDKAKEKQDALDAPCKNREEERRLHKEKEEDKWNKHTLNRETRGNSRARVVNDLNMNRRPGQPMRGYDTVTQVVGPQRPPTWWDRVGDWFGGLFF